MSSSPWTARFRRIPCGWMLASRSGSTRPPSSTSTSSRTRRCNPSTSFWNLRLDTGFVRCVVGQDHSFDIVCKVDEQEVRNAVQMTLKEASQRYDFKGVVVEVVFDEATKAIRLLTSDDLKLKNLLDMLFQKLVKRGVSLKALQIGAVEAKSDGRAAQTLTLQQGIPQEQGKEIVKVIKELRLKAQAGIPDDKVKVTAPKIDDPQPVMVRSAPKLRHPPPVR